MQQQEGAPSLTGIESVTEEGNGHKLSNRSIYIFAVQNFTSIYISVSIKKALIFGKLSEAWLPHPLRTGVVMVMTDTVL